MATPTFSAGTGTPESVSGPATEDNNGSIYLRNNPSGGGTIVYVSKLVDAVHTVYGWESLMDNADVP